ncbi:KH domain-containing protein akap-1 [Cylas formicarius]|uniref:KH domain-containing protein akap-1 n=1 Tax=Cylas formicarius TaxID=197179 RepID=UPI00295837C4|nr:KH domain-containing protein akap-1 [Cylas formicarius]XP_060528609.1 KH domain-containing protein akap-1 [Cylas formicarius]XP_060528610.1 KH domain-containing protein akap-1 [Cylas formicarius]
MAPSPVRQLLAFSLPSIAILLSYLWYKKRRIGHRSDTGGTKPIEDNNKAISTAYKLLLEPVKEDERELKEEHIEKQSPVVTPLKRLDRSLSGVETSPIDIVYPSELKQSFVVSDEDLDVHIEQIKSIGTGCSSPSIISASLRTPPLKSAGRQLNKDNLSKTVPKFNESIIFEAKVISPLKRSVSEPAKSTDIRNMTQGNVGSTEKSQTPTSAVNVSNSAKPLSTSQTNAIQKGNKAVLKKNAKNSGKMQQNIAPNNVSPVHNKREAAGKEMPVCNLPDACKKESNYQNGTSVEELRRQHSGRDSANHSPSDVMMASPSLSSISDNHSEGSNDSGKGGSDLATPPASRTPNTIQLVENVCLVYEFTIPQNLVGKLIGRQGCFVQHIKDKTNAFILVKPHPTNNRLKVCSVEGFQSEIDEALKLIREKFPLKKYPDVTFEQVTLSPLVPTVPLIPDHLYLKLVEGINNDTILSCMVTPNHLFMQQPTHPSYPNLNVLASYMNGCYTENDSPLLPTPIPENTICAAYSVDSWCRAIILSSDEESETSYVKFLDYGGYACVENDKLRQIRQDFMLLPFQASECFLSNVKAKSEDGTWAPQAYDLVADITRGSIIYTQIADYTPEGIPLVLCYVVSGPRDVVFLNQRLVDEGFAEWVSFEDSSKAEPATATVTA